MIAGCFPSWLNDTFCFRYAYPPPDSNILTNIVNALIVVSQFYTQSSSLSCCIRLFIGLITHLVFHLEHTKL
ncbi:hypothetical protein FRX31_002215 [Thalictrum thalictroides]|uniref:Uncharacterized protein n=1 Tax=Thalictrum thalictroides TaxID=46969 RepID=A0A7J6XGI2_THATH|nr:hypothetical protein FRX31_002215 [Thalictrum thalictroides]